MDFVGDPDNEYVSCHILCSTSPRFPCMRGDLPADVFRCRGQLSRIQRQRDTMNDNHIRVGDTSTAGTPDSARRGHARPSVRARMTARLRAARFDRALAVGVPAPAGSALAAHAARLTSVAERQAVARALRRAVRDANATPARRSPGACRCTGPTSPRPRL